MRSAIPILLVLAAACSVTPLRQSTNPAAPSFDVEHSDPRAIAIADEVMEALGGRAAWDATRCLEWTFAGRRTLLWDKQAHDLRLDEGRRVVLMDLDTGEGRVYEDGRPVEDPAARRDALDHAYKAWVNDSYWLLAPYKLKDSGVRLGLAGERTLPGGRTCDVLRVEFDNVGVTPDNAYELCVTRDTHRVVQWSYFEHRDDAEPTMTTPWDGWRRYGRIWLAGDHGQGPAITAIAVHDEPPERLYQP